MKLGLAVAFTGSGDLLAWARRADAGPYQRFGLNDRVVYGNPEPMVMLAAAAAVTGRIRIQTEVLVAPLRDPVLLAKQAATLDRMSGGRFTLGLGVGPRDDDYRAVGADYHRRGRRLDEQMEVLRRVWAGGSPAMGVGPVGPSPLTEGGPEVLFGGFVPKALERVARWGDGYLCSAPPRFTGPMFDVVREQWDDAGRSGEPLLIGQVNVALGAEATLDQARAEMLRQYAFAPDFAGQAVRDLVTTKAGVRDALRTYRDLGAHEVMLGCWSSDLDQIERFAVLAE